MMQRQSEEWKMWIHEPNFEYDNLSYSIEIGYMYHDDTDTTFGDDIYLRLWQGNEFIIGSWLADFEHVDESDMYMKELPPTLVEKCVEVASRVTRLKAFI